MMTIWNKFIASSIVDTSCRPWTGPFAIDLPSTKPLYVITAHNPNARKETDERNAALHDELLHHIATFLPFVTNQWEVTGMNTDGQWKEKGLAIEGIGLQDACAIARAFEQLAFFRLGEETMEVVDAGGIVVKSRPRKC